MSDRDKKLLVYLGALVILAAAYFLVGKPFLDKLDQLAAEKRELQSEFATKQEAYDNKGTYEAGIADAKAKIDKIMAKFPADNTDEKSIMFVVNAEKAVPEWVSQIKFADMTENGLDSQSASDEEAAAEQAAVAAAEGEAVPEGDAAAAEGESISMINGLVSRDTELGIKFSAKYDGFKNWLKYLNDYEDRIVIKDMDIVFEPMTELVVGTMVLSQYAIVGGDRQLPPVETGVEDIGKENVFVSEGHKPGLIDLIGEVAKDLIDAIIGEANGSISESNERYFINVTTPTDNTNAKTIGRAKDPSGTTYLTSNSNEKESVSFTLKGANGNYTAEYELGGYKVTDDEFKTDITGNVVLRVISSSRNGKDDKSAISLHIHNTADIPLIVNVENDDAASPRVEIASKDGDVTVNN